MNGGVFTMFQCIQLTATLENSRTLFPAFDLTIKEKDRLAIIAEEGNGKSTLLKLLSNIPCDYVSVTGKIQSNLSIGYLGQSIQECWLSSNPLEYLLKENPEDIIEPEQYNQCQNLESLCRNMHIDPEFLYLQQTISTLSGGEKVRLQFLKLSMHHYDMYCLDEPTNDLDLDTLEWLENWINSKKEPIIYISHDITLLSNTATRILHLEQRNKKTKPTITLFNGSYQEYVTSRENKRNKDIQVSASEKREYAKQKQRLNDLHNKVQSDLRSVSRQAPHVAKNLKDKMRSVKSSQANLENKSYLKLDSFEEEINIFFDVKPLPASKIILEQKDKVISINDKVLIKPFDFNLHGQDKVVVTGKNGCGKSLWIKETIKELSTREDIKIGYMPQNYSDCFNPNDTPISFLQKNNLSTTQIQTMLGNLKIIESEMNQNIFDCSLGQQAKIYLAKLVCENCNLLFLDEPSRNLSPLSQPVLINALSDFKGCIVCISHDRTLINSVFNRKIKIENHHWIEES